VYEDVVYISSDKTEEIDLDPLKTITLYAIAKDSGSSIQEGMPISNMKIVIENENDFSEIEKITDKDGKVVLNDMYNGNYSFTTEHKSFKHYVGAFSVVKNGEENFNFNPVPFSVSELAAKTNQINIYPNPTVDIVYIEIFLSSNSILQVYDNSGHLIYENKYAGMLNSIDLGGYASGIYNVVIINGDDVFKKRVILK